MKYCSVYGCVNSEFDKELCFHKVKDEWQQSVKWKKQTGFMICSRHFEKKTMFPKNQNDLKLMPIQLYLVNQM